VFSPYYAWSGRRHPEEHCAVNVALYGHNVGRWTMTERGRTALSRTPDSLRIGPSEARWRDGALSISIAEISAPLPRRVRGEVRVRPRAMVSASYDLDGSGRHWWCPLAPVADIEVKMESPRLSWRGSGYLDTNFGTRPLEDDFAAWNWSRARARDGAIVLYDTRLVSGDQRAIGIHIGDDGRVQPIAMPPPFALPSTPIWSIARQTRSDPATVARVERTLEDTPFYARSMVVTEVGGVSVRAIHESLSLERFRQPIVKLMLPFRMPRALR
jgi:carotenoid 1,2-hydratase